MLEQIPALSAIYSLQVWIPSNTKLMKLLVRLQPSSKYLINAVVKKNKIFHNKQAKFSHHFADQKFIYVFKQASSLHLG